MKDPWKHKLTPEQYRVLREKETEAPFSGEYVDIDRTGIYKCVACDNPLFSSNTKFHSGSGWPSFSDVVKNGNVVLLEDNSLGMQRTEVVCAKCHGHLGHLFDDGPMDRGGKRYCINSCVLKLEDEG